MYNPHCYFLSEEGNIEYLIHLRNSNEGYTFNEEDYKQKIIKVVEDSHKLNH